MPSDLNLDMFLFRTSGKEDYVRRLAPIYPDTLELYRSVFDVEQQEFMLETALLRIEFRPWRDPNLFKEFCRHERKARNPIGWTCRTND